MQIPDELAEALATGDLVVFLGAGFAKDSGLPLWGEALEQVACELEKNERTAPHAKLMRVEAEAYRYLEAAELLYLAPLSNDERRQILQNVFGGDPKVSRRQAKLLATPCQGFVTTNYDRSVELSALKAGVDLVSFTESDGDLAYARICDRPFGVRLNGRIEAPEGIVLAKRHYDELPRRDSYIEFFREMFVNRNILFFGFSFMDPFLRQTVSQMGRAVHSVFRRRAFALFPSNPDGDLLEILRDASITPLVYDSARNHQEAWDLFGPREVAVVTSSDDPQIQRVRSEFATVYARSRAKNFVSDRTQVLSGLLMPILQRAGIGSVIPLALFERQARELLALPQSFPAEVIREAAKRLERDGIARLIPEGLEVVSIPGSDVFGRDLGVLVNGLISRARVRFQVPGSALRRSQLAELVSATLIVDGLQVAHGFIRARPLGGRRLSESIERGCRLVGLDGAHSGRVAAALEHLLTHPDREEEQLLAALATLAFSTSLLVADPSAATSQAMTIARGAFFDTNVVLPWLCRGHPVERLSASLVSFFSGKGGAYIIPDYINEIVSHRRLAVETFREAGLEDSNRFRRFVSLFEAHGVNTFIGGYAGLRAAGEAMRFAEYLDTYAPYETEKEAADYVEKRGLSILDVRPDSYALAGGPLFGALSAAFRARSHKREEVRVKHDARQLEILLAHKPQNECPYFLTADKSLIGALSGTHAARVLHRVLLPHQGAYLAEFLGADTVLTGLTRAMWMSSRALHRRIHDYYIDRVLGEYEYALVSELPVIVDAIIGEMEAEEGAVGDIDAGGEEDDRKVRLFNAMDRFEPRFYEKLLDAKRRAGLE